MNYHTFEYNMSLSQVVVNQELCSIIAFYRDNLWIESWVLVLLFHIGHLLGKRISIFCLFAIKLHDAFLPQKACGMDGGSNLTYTFVAFIKAVRKFK